MKKRSGLLAVLGRTSISKIVVVISLFVSTVGLSQSEEILDPEHDAYLQRTSFTSNNETRYNEEVLRVENASIRIRDSYLKFNLSGINGTITNLELQLTIHTDPGSGTINVYKGVGNSWLESNLSNANKPSTPGAPLGSFSGTHSDGAVKTLVINPNILDGDLLSIVLKHTTASDVAFASSGPETSHANPVAPSAEWPKLKVTFTPPNTGDTQAPNVPTGLTVNSFDHESASVSWNATTDNGGGNVAGYYIYNNGTQLTSSTSTTATLTGLSANTPHQLTIAAYDDASPSNLSTPSSSVSFTTSSSSGGNTGSGGYWTKPTSSQNIHYTTGNVGIGTTAISNYKLAVEGKIRAREVKVDNDTWADYVFFDDYKLPSLQEVEQHIQEKGHLIHIPSAAEVEANGIELGEMNKLLLEKIEELTLYIIEQEKRILVLEKSN